MFRSFFLAVALCFALLCTVSAAPIGTDGSIEALARRLASRPEKGDLLFERRSAGVKVGLQPRARVSYRTDKSVKKQGESGQSSWSKGQG